MKMNGWYVAGAIVAALIIFQSFLRYQYEHLAGGRVMRIDRLTGSSCYMPCVPQPGPAETPERTFESDDLAAIDWVKTVEIRPYENDGHQYMWRVWERVKNDGTQAMMTQDMSAEDPSEYPIRLVCYCYNDTPGQKSPTGVWWEYHLDTKKVYSVSDNAPLSVKYGMHSP